MDRNQLQETPDGYAVSLSHDLPTIAVREESVHVVQVLASPRISPDLLEYAGQREMPENEGGIRVHATAVSSQRRLAIPFLLPEQPAQVV